jgi:hypothetical protein
MDGFMSKTQARRFGKPHQDPHRKKPRKMEKDRKRQGMF